MGELRSEWLRMAENGLDIVVIIVYTDNNDVDVSTGIGGCKDGDDTGKR